VAALLRMDCEGSDGRENRADFEVEDSQERASPSLLEVLLDLALGPLVEVKSLQGSLGVSQLRQDR